MPSDVPQVDYRATALRLEWDALPPGALDVVARACGQPVVRASRPAGSGFSRGYAGLVRLADGSTAFVKAAGADLSYAHPSYRREAEVLAALPPAVPAPRLRGVAEGDVDGVDWVAIAIEPIVGGRMPGQPWGEGDLAAAHEACLVSAQALTPGPPELDLPRLSEVMTAEGTGGVGAATYFERLARAEADLPPGQPDWTIARAPTLAGLMGSMADVLQGGTAVHGDLRGDNLLIDSAGRMWVFDWNWLCLGPAWTDFVGLLPLARADGVDVDAWVRRSPLTHDLDPDALDVWLAVTAAYMLSGAGPDEVEPLGTHRRRFARTFLDWLAARRGWAQRLPAN